MQRHYIAAIQKVAERLADFEHVLGYDTLNEPAAGYIALPTLEAAPWPLKIGPSPTPFQSMLLGAGFPQEVDLYELKATGPKKIGTQVLNPDGSPCGEKAANRSGSRMASGMWWTASRIC